MASRHTFLLSIVTASSIIIISAISVVLLWPILGPPPLPTGAEQARFQQGVAANQRIADQRSRAILNTVQERVDSGELVLEYGHYICEVGEVLVPYAPERIMGCDYGPCNVEVVPAYVDGAGERQGARYDDLHCVQWGLRP